MKDVLAHLQGKSASIDSWLRQAKQSRLCLPEKHLFRRGVCNKCGRRKTELLRDAIEFIRLHAGT